MSSLNPTSPLPTDITLHQQSRRLEMVFDDGRSFDWSFEFLRVHSPSAEVRGHGIGQEVLQTGKRNVLLQDIEYVGNYALRLIFSDGHNSGLYSWDYFYQLGTQKDRLWQNYLQRLTQAGASRD